VAGRGRIGRENDRGGEGNRGREGRGKEGGKGEKAASLVRGWMHWVGRNDITLH